MVDGRRSIRVECLSVGRRGEERNAQVELIKCLFPKPDLGLVYVLHGGFGDDEGLVSARRHVLFFWEGWCRDSIVRRKGECVRGGEGRERL